MSDEDNSPKTDGGIEHEIFSSSGESDAIVSPGQRIERLLDLYIYTPLRVAWSDWRARIGGLMILFYIAMGTIGVVLVPEPALNEGTRYLGAFENWSIPLGTDNVGRSIGKQIVHATPAMLKMALAGVIFSAGVATLVGLVAGYKGGVVDKVLMTLTDIVLTLPGLPLIVVIAAIYPPKDPFLVGALLAIDSWPGLARALRSQVLTLREESYVEASRAAGLSTPTIINRDIMPQLMPYISINAASAAAGVIGASVGLYFLGILPFTTNNWGVMMNSAHTQGALANPEHMGHWLFFPALALSGMTFALVLFSQGMDRVFNPRLRARHSNTIVDEEGTEEDDGGPMGKQVTSAQK